MVFEKQEKVCQTFSIRYFMANCKSTQRSESVNSLAKQNGRMKNALKTTRIEDLMLHMDALTSHQDSSFVDEKWKLEQLHVNCCAASACMSNAKVIIVYCCTKVHAPKWSVMVPKQDFEVPTCQCHHFRNTQIPCHYGGTAFWFCRPPKLATASVF
jgi:hypothetical protein